MRSYARIIARAQGTYFVATALWALVSVSTFMAVTGPKTDVWLVKTVAVLMLVIGAVLILAARRNALSPEIAFLASTSALGLACLEVIYVSMRVISPVYLLDALPELLLVLAWGTASRAPRAPKPEGKRQARSAG